MSVQSSSNQIELHFPNPEKRLQFRQEEESEFDNLFHDHIQGEDKNAEDVQMADHLRPIEELLRIPILGIENAIVVPTVLADKFELKPELLDFVKGLLNDEIPRDLPPLELSNDPGGDILFLENLLKDKPLEVEESEIYPLIGEPSNTFLIGDEEIKVDPFKEIDDPVPNPKVSKTPMDSLDYILDSYDTSYTNPSVHDSEYTLNYDNLIFNIQNGHSDEPETETIMSLFNKEQVADSDFVLPVENVVIAQNRFANSLVGFFVGKSVAFPLVQNYVTNAWSKFGFQKVIHDDDDVFYLKFTLATDLKKEITMVVPIVNDEGYSKVRMNVEYKWKPSRCTECHVFEHDTNEFPTRVVEPVIETSDNQGDDDDEVSTKGTSNSGNSGFTVGKPSGGSGGSDIFGEPEPTIALNTVDSDSEVEETLVVEKPAVTSLKGASTPSNDDWTSNARLCPFGCRIIVGWNVDVTNLMIISQSSQAMHVKLFHKATNKTIYCSFIYAGNTQSERCLLWAGLGKHKLVVHDLPWILMGDFHMALNMEDMYAGSSSMSSAMCDFKDCVAKIEVVDINSSGLHYTWTQKPKGGNGILKKLDRIMGNIDFIDNFAGAYAIFQPYRISDHALVVLKIHTLVAQKPKPFKFFNFLTHKSKFMEVVQMHWNFNVEGYNMFKVVSKMKILKKPLRKLLHDHGNLHERVKKLRMKLDEVQKALDLNPTDPILREEESIYLQAFNEAKLDEERFLEAKKLK
ncbi:RNA-directed DNA polymerase, eukaryota, reverse transcriptase zinc-binding domain protein [Tanacetum coccineum]